MKLRNKNKNWTKRFNNLNDINCGIFVDFVKISLVLMYPALHIFRLNNLYL